MKKIDVAREQLITALDLFLEDKSPVSVHSLAGNAREIIERLCRKEGVRSFVDDIKLVFPDMSDKELRSIIHKYRNSFKHNDPDKDDSEIIANFSDLDNEAILFVAIHDYGRLVGGKAMTMDMQVFEAWYCVSNPERMNDEWIRNNTQVFEFFSEILNKDRGVQKMMLQELSYKYKHLEEVA